MSSASSIITLDENVILNNI